MSRAGSRPGSRGGGGLFLPQQYNPNPSSSTGASSARAGGGSSAGSARGFRGTSAVARSMEADAGQLRSVGYRPKGSDTARGGGGFLDAATSLSGVSGSSKPGTRLPGPPAGVHGATPIRPKRVSGSAGAGGGERGGGVSSHGGSSRGGSGGGGGGGGGKSTASRGSGGGGGGGGGARVNEVGPVGAAAAAAHRASTATGPPTGSNVGFGARGGGWSGTSRPADLHKHLDDNDDALFDPEAAAMQEENEYALRVVNAVGTAGGAGFTTAVGHGPRSLSVAHINARDRIDDDTLPYHGAPPDDGEGEDALGGSGGSPGDGSGSIAAVAVAVAAGLPDEVVERFAVLEERLRIAERCANEYCSERDMALTELDSALASVQDLHREKEALEEALNDAEEVAGQKTTAAAAMAAKLRELGDAAAASEGQLAVANKAAANATAAAAAAHRAATEAAAANNDNGGGGGGGGGGGERPPQPLTPDNADNSSSTGTSKKMGPMAEMEEALQEISELQAKTDEALGGAGPGQQRGVNKKRSLPPGSEGKSGRGGGVAAAEGKGQKDLALLQGRVEMSRSIMRKLYKKNVELEKENQLAKAAALREQEKAAAAMAALAAAAAQKGDKKSGDTSEETARAALTALEGGGVDGRGALGLAAMGIGAPSDGGSSIYSTMVRERDKTIEELRATVAELRRDQRAREGHEASSAAALSAADLQEVVSQSAQHFTKYKQIRADYRRLLTRRVEAVRRTGGANTEAKKVVEELHHRLNREIQEREAEAAIYSARLYETEQQQSDWYVEKRLLEGKVEKLDAEVAERDRLDAQIEACVAHLFERMRLLEKTNVTLTEKLGSMGLIEEAKAAQAALKPVEVSADVAKALPALAADAAAAVVGAA